MLFISAFLRTSKYLYFQKFYKSESSFKIYLMKTRMIFALTGIILLSLYFASCQHEPELMPGTPEICFDSDVMLIINSNCNISGCHGSGGEAPSLNTYEDVSRFVTPGKPMESELHKVITAHSNLMGLMPPKPNPSLTSSQIDIISLWILQGANHTTCP